MNKKLNSLESFYAFTESHNPSFMVLTGPEDGKISCIRYCADYACSECVLSDENSISPFIRRCSGELGAFGTISIEEYDKIKSDNPEYII